jgi:hypothetical protein
LNEENALMLHTSLPRLSNRSKARPSTYWKQNPTPDLSQRERSMSNHPPGKLHTHSHVTGDVDRDPRIISSATLIEMAAQDLRINPGATTSGRAAQEIHGGSIK